MQLGNGVGRKEHRQRKHQRQCPGLTGPDDVDAACSHQTEADRRRRDQHLANDDDPEHDVYRD